MSDRYYVTEISAVDADGEDDAIQRVVSDLDGEVVEQSAILVAEQDAQDEAERGMVLMDPSLAIDLTPTALREMFEDDDPEDNPVRDLGDEHLTEIAHAFLDGLVWRDIRSYVREQAEVIEGSP